MFTVFVLDLFSLYVRYLLHLIFRKQCSPMNLYILTSSKIRNEIANLILFKHSWHCHVYFDLSFALKPRWNWQLQYWISVKPHKLSNMDMKSVQGWTYILKDKIFKLPTNVSCNNLYQTNESVTYVYICFSFYLWNQLHILILQKNTL